MIIGNARPDMALLQTDVMAPLLGLVTVSDDDEAVAAAAACPYALGATIFGSKGIAPAGKYAGYEPLVKEIVQFFKTGVAPVRPEETIEIFAFMEAADESKRQGGAPVKLADVMERARKKD